MNSQQIATKPTSFELELQSYEPQFAAALPGHIPVEKFRRTVITALNAQPDLVKADRRSLFTACVRAAQDGLFPDGREAALVIFNTKNQKTGEWLKQVQYMPMIGGLIKRMRNSGELAAISAYVVFSNDAFDYELGDDPHINHKPAMGDRGHPIGVYAIAKLTNGEVLREVMSVSEVDKIRAVSRSRDNGPWVQWWEEMARKSVIRRLAKRLPGSADIDAILQREDEQYRPQLNGAAVPAQRPTRAMFQPRNVLEYQESEDRIADAHDPETGEIEEDNDPDRLSEEPSLLDQGDAKCEEGLASLETWWRALTSAQRGELGAKGRSSGRYMEGWKVRAQAADERGGPMPDDPETDEEEEKPSMNYLVEGSGKPVSFEALKEAFGKGFIPETYPDDPDKLNWGAWCLKMVDAMGDADAARLVVLRKQCALYPTAPTSILADLDRAYDLRAAELRDPSSETPRL